ncbi:TetR/AcrR family transcriptional regulator [Flavobacterium sp. '19STA2R22 D10 B1']|uniref:TetR/AcrR family transcriptional regulator n=1 Tax=Flavobacterium aerium TaxID=3037261 RepID=UPI00278BCE60|nr:TetR/AcrR family transcriptional regulator [Flavobacterium sp. '19STA2R22 D10 B1']
MIHKVTSVMARTKAFDKDEVLDKAVDLFWQKGYQGTSAQDIVDCLGISRSSLYDTFGDKHTLFVAALKRYKSKMGNPFIEIIEQTEDAKKAIHQIFQMILDESIDQKCNKGCFMVNATMELSQVDPEITAIINRNTQDMEEAFCMAIEKGQKMGTISTVHDPRKIALFLINAISGLRVTAKTDIDRAKLNDIVCLTISIL